MPESPESQGSAPWPYDKPPPTPHERVASLLIADWRWQRFDETSVSDPDSYPAFGWLRIHLEETEAGDRYEVREWHFGVDLADDVDRKLP